MFRDLFFCGYPEGDYPFMNVGLLRGARRAFKLQIKLTTIYSLVIIGIDLIANMGYFVRASYGEIRNNTTFKVEMVFLILGLIFALAAVKSKTAAVLMAAEYLVAAGLLLFKGDGMSVLMCILGAAFYVKMIFTHIHLKRINARKDIDDFEQIKRVVAADGDPVKSLQYIYDTHGKGRGVSTNNPMSVEKILMMDPTLYRDYAGEMLNEEVSYSKDRYEKIFGIEERKEEQSKRNTEFEVEAMLKQQSEEESMLYADKNFRDAVFGEIEEMVDKSDWLSS